MTINTNKESSTAAIQFYARATDNKTKTYPPFYTSN